MRNLHANLQIVSYRGVSGPDAFFHLVSGTVAVLISDTLTGPWSGSDPYVPGNPARDGKIASHPVEYSSLTAAQLFACCEDPRNELAWREFCARYHKLLVVTAKRVAGDSVRRDSELVEDLVQDVYAKVCRYFPALRAAAERGDGGETKFLKAFAANSNRDYFRRMRAQKRGSLLELPLSESMDHPLDGEAIRVEQKLMMEEVERLLRAAPSRNHARDLCIFKLHYEHGLSAEKISKLPRIGLTPQGVDGVIRRLLQYLKQNLAKSARNGGTS